MSFSAFSRESPLSTMFLRTIGSRLASRIAERAGPSISMRLFAAEDVLAGAEGTFLTASIKSRASASVELSIT